MGYDIKVGYGVGITLELAKDGLPVAVLALWTRYARGRALALGAAWLLQCRSRSYIAPAPSCHPARKWSATRCARSGCLSSLRAAYRLAIVGGGHDPLFVESRGHNSHWAALSSIDMWVLTARARVPSHHAKTPNHNRFKRESFGRDLCGPSEHASPFRDVCRENSTTMRRPPSARQTRRPRCDHI